MKKSILSLLLAVCAFGAFAQDGGKGPTDADYARKPLWVPMLDDTLANYFVVEHAFETYFRHHERPEGEDEVIGEYRKRLKHFSKRKLRRTDAENTLRLHVKRYYWWRQQMQPYVQNDGRILTPTERLAVWQAQKG